MDWHLTLGIMSGILQITSVVPYVWDMIRGQTRPNVVTYLAWWFFLVVAVFAQFDAGASWSIIVQLAVLFNTSLILFLIFKGYGYKKYYKTDYVCFALAILSLIVWQITKMPTLVILFAVLADLFSIIPTILKTHREPYSENTLAWFLSFLAACLAIFSTTQIDVANLAFPIWYFFTDLTITILAFWGQRKIGRN